MQNKKSLKGALIIRPLSLGGTRVVVPTSRVETVTQDKTQSKVFVRFHTQPTEEIDDTIASVYAQQTGNNFSLGMLLVTNSEKSLQEIVFTHNIRQIVPEGTGAKIVFDDKIPAIYTDETVASIFAQQTAAIKLGMLLVTSAETGATSIEMWSQIKNIYPEGTGSKINFLSGRGPLTVTETPLTIFNAQ